VDSYVGRVEERFRVPSTNQNGSPKRPEGLLYYARAGAVVSGVLCLLALGCRTSRPIVQERAPVQVRTVSPVRPVATVQPEQWQSTPQRTTAPQTPPAQPQPWGAHVNQDLQTRNAQLAQQLTDARQELERVRGQLTATHSGLVNAERDRQQLAAQLQASGAGNVSVGIKQGNVTVTLPERVFFQSGSAQLRSTAKSELQKVVAAIRMQFPGRAVRVEGHTDNEPIKRSRLLYRSNWDLSAARATTVLHYLVNECGMDSANIYLAGFGEHHPIADNATEQGRQRNRRVEMVILPGPLGSSRRW